MFRVLGGMHNYVSIGVGDTRTLKKHRSLSSTLEGRRQAPLLVKPSQPFLGQGAFKGYCRDLGFRDLGI